MIKILLDNQNEFKLQARYIFETFFEIIGTPVVFTTDPADISTNDILIYYGKNKDLETINGYKIIIPESNWILWEKYKPKIKSIDNTPVIYEEDLIEDRIVTGDDSGTSFTINFDMIAASFYFLNRQEERINKKRDIWGCFSEEFSVSHEWQITQIPVVNIYIEILLKLLLKIGQAKGEIINVLPRWKDNRKFAVALTHDIDNARKYSLINGLRLLARKISKREGNFNNIFAVLAMALFNKKSDDPYWKFNDFIELESRFTSTSTFFVISQSLNRKYDPFYKLDRHLSEQLRVILDKGWDIGVHGAYDSFEDENMLKEQKKKLEMALKKPVFGIRQHYLRFSVERTFFVQDKAGFVYDSTLGYNEDIGFRSGLAMPFSPFDIKKRKRLNILEMPLAIMDGSLFDFKRYSPREAFNRVKELIDRVENLGGLAVILWHIKARDEKDFPGWWDVYGRILEYLHAKEAWITNASEICNWWLNRIENVWNSRDH